MINKVGCPIDLYFAPPKIDPASTHSCEIYADHMGSLDSFLQSGRTDVNSYDSPAIHQRTYNSHSFAARTSHDNSLVMRIDIEADVVRDCPELKRRVAQVSFGLDGVVVQSMGEMSVNVTEVVVERIVTVKPIKKPIGWKRNGTEVKMDHFANLTHVGLSDFCEGVACGPMHRAS